MEEKWRRGERRERVGWKGQEQRKARKGERRGEGKGREGSWFQILSHISHCINAFMYLQRSPPWPACERCQYCHPFWPRWRVYPKGSLSFCRKTAGTAASSLGKESEIPAGLPLLPPPSLYWSAWSSQHLWREHPTSHLWLPKPQNTLFSGWSEIVKTAITQITKARILLEKIGRKLFVSKRLVCPLEQTHWLKLQFSTASFHWPFQVCEM